METRKASYLYKAEADRSAVSSLEQQPRRRRRSFAPQCARISRARALVTNAKRRSAIGQFWHVNADAVTFQVLRFGPKCIAELILILCFNVLAKLATSAANKPAKTCLWSVTINYSFQV